MEHAKDQIPAYVEMWIKANAVWIRLQVEDLSSAQKMYYSHLHQNYSMRKLLQILTTLERVCQEEFQASFCCWRISAPPKTFRNRNFANSTPQILHAHRARTMKGTKYSLQFRFTSKAKQDRMRPRLRRPHNTRGKIPRALCHQHDC